MAVFEEQFHRGEQNQHKFKKGLRHRKDDESFVRPHEFRSYAQHLQRYESETNNLCVRSQFRLT